jgi:hypothetical protein
VGHALEQDVVGLEVAVQHALRVGGRDRRADREHQRRELAGGDPTAPDPGRERLAVEHLHHEVGHPPEGADVRHVDHVGVADARRRPALAEEALDDLDVAREVGAQGLEGHPLAEVAVLGLVDDPHAPFAELAEHLVAPEHGAGLRGRLETIAHVQGAIARFRARGSAVRPVRLLLCRTR